jgi:hypothetical protein
MDSVSSLLIFLILAAESSCSFSRFNHAFIS